MLLNKFHTVPRNCNNSDNNTRYDITDLKLTNTQRTEGLSNCLDAKLFLSYDQKCPQEKKRKKKVNQNKKTPRKYIF